MNNNPSLSSATSSVFHVRIDLPLASEKENIAESLENKKLQLLLKRAFDVLVSGLFILLLSPVLLITAILIKLTSKGKILYSNERVGLNGEHFRCYKFRSMVANQAAKQTDYKTALESQKNGILHKVKNDSRITWIGKIIRKTSIDELPQLFNVFLGDMSIIGPRPLVPFMLEPYPDFKEIRCMVKPGITGLWQIRDRKNNTSAEYMMSHDVEYIKNINLLLDFKILATTPIVVLKAEGAY